MKFAMSDEITGEIAECHKDCERVLSGFFASQHGQCIIARRAVTHQKHHAQRTEDDQTRPRLIVKEAIKSHGGQRLSGELCRDPCTHPKQGHEGRSAESGRDVVMELHADKIERRMPEGFCEFLPPREPSPDLRRNRHDVGELSQHSEDSAAQSQERDALALQPGDDRIPR